MPEQLLGWNSLGDLDQTAAQAQDEIQREAFVRRAELASSWEGVRQRHPAQ